MKVIGIDNGLSGGIVMVSEEGVLEKYPMPTIKVGKKNQYDVNQIARLIRHLSPDKLAIEKAQAYLIELEGKEPSNRHDTRPKLITRLAEVLGGKTKCA